VSVVTRREVLNITKLRTLVSTNFVLFEYVCHGE